MAKANIHEVKDDEEKIELILFGYSHVAGGKDGKIIEVTLSERNLLSLLTKLYIDGSKRTIYNGDVPDGYVLKLVAESDEEHYEGRDKPGVMHPRTEELVDLLKAVMEDYQSRTKVIHLRPQALKG